MAGFTHPTHLILHDKDHGDLKRQVVAELAKGPLGPNEHIELSISATYGSQILECQVYWTPTAGFVVPGLRGPHEDIPLCTSTQAVARGLEGGRRLSDFVIVQHCLANAPRSAKSVNFALPDGELVHVDRTVQLTIKYLSGKELSLTMASSNNISDVWVKIAAETGTPPDQLALHFAGQPLEDGTRTLSACGVVDGSTLDLVLRLQ